MRTYSFVHTIYLVQVHSSNLCIQTHSVHFIHSFVHSFIYSYIQVHWSDFSQTHAFPKSSPFGCVERQRTVWHSELWGLAGRARHFFILRHVPCDIFPIAKWWVIRMPQQSSHGGWPARPPIPTSQPAIVLHMFEAFLVILMVPL